MRPARPSGLTAFAASNAAIADLHAATHIVIATPMFNFDLPWTLKAYVDLIVRAVGKTFSFNPTKGFGPLLSPGKKLMIVWSSAGDYAPGTPTETLGRLTLYLRQVFGFMGIGQTEVVSAGNMWGGPEAVNASLAAARARLTGLSAKCRAPRPASAIGTQPMQITTTELFLAALLAIFTLPYLFWRLLGQRNWAPLVAVQIVSGILHGFEVLGTALPNAYAFIFNDKVITALNGAAWWAVMMFVWITGIESDLRETWSDGAKRGRWRRSPCWCH